MKEEAEKRNWNLFIPEFRYTTDNAAMIAGLGYHCFQRQGCGDPLTLEPMTRIPL